MRYSIVIPTLNEESTLISNFKFLQSLKEKLEAEIIIVDGQSCDRTKEIAGSLTDKIYDVNPSRSCNSIKASCMLMENIIFFFM